MGFQSVEEMVDRAKEKNLSLWEVVLQDDMREREVTKEESMDTMRNMYEVMRQADATYAGKHKSPSEMVGGDGAKLALYVEQGKNLSGSFLGMVMEKAVRMAESNACMGRIVAAPTAGSCGVMPAVLLSYEATKGCERDRLVEALFVAAGIGQVIASRASIAGASGGCQAEIGAASAMAAAAVCTLENGTMEAVMDAAAIALKGLLGLTCDPVAGLVEVPCVKRNVIGAVNAVTSADLAMAGISSVIPLDEVIDAMGEIGKNMSAKYRETSEGGLSMTPTAQAISARIIRSEQ